MGKNGKEIKIIDRPRRIVIMVRIILIRFKQVSTEELRGENLNHNSQKEILFI